MNGVILDDGGYGDINIARCVNTVKNSLRNIDVGNIINSGIEEGNLYIARLYIEFVFRCREFCNTIIISNNCDFHYICIDIYGEVRELRYIIGNIISDIDIAKAIDSGMIEINAGKIQLIMEDLYMDLPQTICNERRIVSQPEKVLLCRSTGPGRSSIVNYIGAGFTSEIVNSTVSPIVSLTVGLTLGPILRSLTNMVGRWFSTTIDFDKLKNAYYVCGLSYLIERGNFCYRIFIQILEHIGKIHLYTDIGTLDTIKCNLYKLAVLSVKQHGQIDESRVLIENSFQDFLYPNMQNSLFYNTVIIMMVTRHDNQKMMKEIVSKKLFNTILLLSHYYPSWG